MTLEKIATLNKKAAAEGGDGKANGKKKKKEKTDNDAKDEPAWLTVAGQQVGIGEGSSSTAVFGAPSPLGSPADDAIKAANLALAAAYKQKAAELEQSAKA